jgi:hypothetical protein
LNPAHPENLTDLRASMRFCTAKTLHEWANGSTTHVGHDAATDVLDRIEENVRIHIDSLTGDAFATGNALFWQSEQFSSVAACVVASTQTEGLAIGTRSTTTSTLPRTSIVSIQRPLPPNRSDTDAVAVANRDARGDAAVRQRQTTGCDIVTAGAWTVGQSDRRRARGDPSTP